MIDVVTRRSRQSERPPVHLDESPTPSKGGHVLLRPRALHLEGARRGPPAPHVSRHRSPPGRSLAEAASPQDRGTGRRLPRPADRATAANARSRGLPRLPTRESSGEAESVPVRVRDDERGLAPRLFL